MLYQNYDALGLPSGLLHPLRHSPCSGLRKLTVCRSAPNICGDRNISTYVDPPTSQISEQGILGSPQVLRGPRSRAVLPIWKGPLDPLLPVGSATRKPMGSSSRRGQGEEDEIRACVLLAPSRGHCGATLNGRAQLHSALPSQPSLASCFCPFPARPRLVTSLPASVTSLGSCSIPCPACIFINSPPLMSLCHNHRSNDLSEELIN